MRERTRVDRIQGIVLVSRQRLPVHRSLPERLRIESWDSA